MPTDSMHPSSPSRRLRLTPRPRAAGDRRTRGLVVAGALTVMAAIAQAATPVFWHVSTQEDFLSGEVDQLSIDATGRLTLGPVSADVFDPTAPFLWTAARSTSALWVGSGNDGRVFRVDATGDGREVFDATELNVHAIAPVDDETAFVASSPDGRVYRITTGAEAPRVVFDPDEQYIWALARSPVDNALYVATGEPGRIYRVEASGESALYHDTGTTHALTLAFDAEGHLLVGTGSPGRVVRVTPDGRGFVVVDSGFAEIRSIRVAADGTAYAVAVSESPARAATGSTSATATSTAETTPATASSATSTSTVVTVTASAAPPGNGASSGGGTASGAVYRIAPDGVWDVAWESASETPYDVVPPGPDSSGLLIATGDDGKIFRVRSAPRRVELVARAAATHVTTLVPAAGGGVDYLTANPGKVHRLSRARAEVGTFVSDVHDASTVATWGTVRWRATTPSGARVRLFTRSGNTADPDETWSPWSDPYTDADGSPVLSPKARYIQWKAELTGGDDTPVLFSVTTAYLPRNLSPEVTSLTVHEPGVAFQQPFSGTDPPIAGLDPVADARTSTPAGAGEEAQSGALGRRVYRRGLRTFVWDARDGNQDQLDYDVLYRRETESAWRPLATALRATIFTWDTTSTPDGTYVVRVVATDARSNAPGSASSGYADSAPFEIDNTAPDLVVEPARQEAEGAVVPFLVEDAQTPVSRVEFSLDTEHWQVLYPLDGIPDTRRERFEVTVAPDDLPHLVIRATDGLGNTVTAAGR